MSRSPRKHPDATRPDLAWRSFLRAVEEGRVEVHPRVHDRLSEAGIHLGELGAALRAAAEEIRLSDAKSVSESWDPPGHAFLWDSRRFGRRMYLKFRLEGRRPRVVLYSFHPADHQTRSGEQ